MPGVLFSIHPKYIEKILSNEKHYEFRKTRAKVPVDRMYIYATAPVKMVVAEAKIEDILEDDIDGIWNQTKDFAGISREAFCAYYQNKTKAVAYKLRDVQIYKQPKKLSDFGITHAPQSYIYIKP